MPEDFGSPEQFLQILTTPPNWADGLPIAAKVRVGERFCKITKVEPQRRRTGRDAAPVNIEVGSREDHNDAHSGNRLRSDNEQEARSGNNYASGERRWGRNVTDYIYRDANGANYLRVVRTSAKQFPQYHWENGRWLKGKPAGPKHPYRLPELLGAAPETPVFICEGEKDANERRRARARRDHKLGGCRQVDRRSQQVVHGKTDGIHPRGQ